MRPTSISSPELGTVGNNHPTSPETSTHIPIFQSSRHLSLPSHLPPAAPRSSLDPSMTSDTQGDAMPFKLFNLPPEIRHMIFEYALDVQRIVIVDQNYYANSKLRTTEILEDYPPLLQLCRESRIVALKKYGTVSPEVPLKGWAFTEIKKMGQLRAILKKLDSSVKQGQTIAIVVRQILSYMNSYPEQHEEFSKFAEYSRRCRPVIRPCWFDPSSDILLVKPLYDRLFHIGINDLESRKRFCFQGGDVPFSQLRFLAVILQVYDDWRSINYQSFMPWLKRQWPIDQQWEQLEPRLGWLAILCPLTCEVVIITRALEAESKYHEWKQKWEWSYSLDTESQQFREEMGHRWANVTWRVKVPHSWSLWSPVIEYWFQEKSKLCKDHPDIGDNWHEVNRHSMRSFRNNHPRLPDRSPTLVENGDGRTYVGPI